jgi:uncharacterized membrane protein (DUF485 family)
MNPDPADPLRRLAARRWRLAVALTAIMIAAYVGFILLSAFDKRLAGALLLDGRISLGIVLGAGLIVLAAVLTGIYVRWANRVYDVELARLRRERAR